MSEFKDIEKRTRLLDTPEADFWYGQGRYDALVETYNYFRHFPIDASMQKLFDWIRAMENDGHKKE